MVLLVTGLQAAIPQGAQEGLASRERATLQDRNPVTDRGGSSTRLFSWVRRLAISNAHRDQSAPSRDVGRGSCFSGESGANYGRGRAEHVLALHVDTGRLCLRQRLHRPHSPTAPASLVPLIVGRFCPSRSGSWQRRRWLKLDLGIRHPAMPDRFWRTRPLPAPLNRRTSRTWFEKSGGWPLGGSRQAAITSPAPSLPSVSAVDLANRRLGASHYVAIAVCSCIVTWFKDELVPARRPVPSRSPGFPRGARAGLACRSRRSICRPRAAFRCCWPSLGSGCCVQCRCARQVHIVCLSCVRSRLTGPVAPQAPTMLFADACVRLAIEPLLSRLPGRQLLGGVKTLPAGLVLASIALLALHPLSTGLVSLYSVRWCSAVAGRHRAELCDSS